MKLDYSLSKEQLRAFTKLSCHRLAVRRGGRALLMTLNILAWMAIAFGTAIFVNLYKEAPGFTSELNSLAIPLVVAVAAIIAGLLYQQRLQFNAAFADDSWPRIRLSVAAGPSSLEISAPGVHTRYEWCRFIEVLEDAAAIYLFLDASHAVIVPKAAFVSPEDMNEFLSWAKSPNEMPHATCEDVRA